MDQRFRATGSGLRIPKDALRSNAVIASLPVLEDSYPLALIVLSGILENRGIPHRVLDAALSFSSLTPLKEHAERATLLDEPAAVRRENLSRTLAGLPEVVESLAEALVCGGEPLVCLSLFRSNADLSVLVAQRLKQEYPDRLVVLGGPEMLGRSREYAGIPWIDAVVEGEGEDHIASLVACVARGLPIEADPLRGLITRSAGTDGYPAVGSPWEVFSYRPLGTRLSRAVFRDPAVSCIPVIYSRGCSRRCRFCLVRRYLGRWRAPRVEHHLRQIAIIESLLKEYAIPFDEVGTPFLDYYDNIFNGNRNECLYLLRAMAERHPNLPKACHLGEDAALLDPAFVRALLAAGIRWVSLGVESGSDRVRRAMGKPMKVSQVERMIHLFLEGGMEVVTLLFMVGWPDETQEEFEETLRLVERLNDHRIVFHVQPFQVYSNADFPDWPGLAKSGASGIRWKAASPAGDPGERLARYEAVRDTLHGRNRLFPAYDMSMLEEWMGKKNPRRPAPGRGKVVFAEFATLTRPMRGMLFPYAVTLIRERSDREVSWLRFAVPDDLQRKMRSSGVDLDNQERLTLSGALPLSGEAFLVFSAKPAEALKEFVRRMNPDIRIGWVPDLGTVRPSDPAHLDGSTSRWCRFLGLPERPDDPYFLHESVLPEFSFTPANPMARALQPIPYLLFGAFCAHRRPFQTPSGTRSSGCSFCLLSEGPRKAPRIRLDRARKTLAALVRGLRDFANRLPLVRLLGSRVLPDLAILAQAILAEVPFGCKWLLDARATEIIRHREDLSRAAASLGERGHVLCLSLTGIESFSSRDLERFNKGVRPLDNLAAIETLLDLERRHPDSFSFREFGGLSTILLTPWSTLEDITRTLAIIRTTETAALAGKLLGSKLRLSRDLPLTHLADDDGLLRDRFDDPAFEIASEALYEPEIPWAFRNAPVRELARILVRLDHPVEDALGRRVSGAVRTCSQKGVRRLDIALGLADTLASSEWDPQAPRSSEDLIEHLERIAATSPEAPLLPPPLVHLGQPVRTEFLDLLREQEIPALIALVKDGHKPVAMIEALEPEAAHEIVSRWSPPNPVVLPSFVRPGLSDLFFGVSPNRVREMVALKTRLCHSRSEQEELSAQASIGRWLGYPDCCVRAYVEDRGRFFGSDAWLLLERRLAQPGKVALEMMPFAHSLSLPVPCRLDCPEALAMARRALESVLGSFPGEEDRIRASLSHPWLVSLEQDGPALELIPEGRVCERFRYRAGRSHVEGWFARAVRAADEILIEEDALMLLRGGMPLLDVTGRAFVWWHQEALQTTLMASILRIRSFMETRRQGVSVSSPSREDFRYGGSASRRRFEWLLGLDHAPEDWRVRFVGATQDRILVALGPRGHVGFLLTIRPADAGEPCYFRTRHIGVSYQGSSRVPEMVERWLVNQGRERIAPLKIADLQEVLTGDPGTVRGERAREVIEALIRAMARGDDRSRPPP